MKRKLSSKQYLAEIKADIFATRLLGCDELREALREWSGDEPLLLVVGGYHVSHQSLDLRVSHLGSDEHLYIGCEACSRVEFFSGYSAVKLEIITIDAVAHHGSHFRLLGSHGELLVECAKIYLSWKPPHRPCCGEEFIF